MITAGVAVDNYKIGKFTKELEKEGFKVSKTVAFTKDTSVLHVATEASRVQELHRLLLKLQTDATRSN